jgi:serine O-acetyltransferase
VSFHVYRIYKVANTLYRWKIPFLPRIIYYFMRFAFTTSIPYTASIGRNTYFNNWGMGIVIHRRVVVGENCRIGHGVTIGGRSEHYEVPVIGNDVLVGVGATILGPVKVGDHATVGANALVIDNVPPNAVVVGVPARIIKYTNDAGEDRRSA